MDRKTRILRVIARMNVGGPAVQISNLESKLDSENFEHLLVTGDCDETEIDYLRLHNIELDLITIPELGRNINPVQEFVAFLKLRRIMTEFRPDIVHTHTAKAGLLGRLAASTCGKDIFLVHTYHGHLLHGYFNRCLTWLVIQIERMLAKRTDVLVSVGSNVRDELLAVKIGALNQYRIVNPGLQIHSLPERTEVCAKFNLDPNLRYLGWLGRLVTIKRPDRIIEIARSLKHTNPKVRILVSGDGPLRDEIESTCKRESLPVHFTGWISDVESLLSVIECMILTSDNEGTPISLIQAQMAGLPTVATNVGSVSEIVTHGETGFLAKPDETFLFANYIKALLDNPSMAKNMGLKAKSNSLKKFSVNRLVKDHVKIYSDLILTIKPASGPKL